MVRIRGMKRNELKTGGHAECFDNEAILSAAALWLLAGLLAQSFGGRQAGTNLVKPFTFAHPGQSMAVAVDKGMTPEVVESKPSRARSGQAAADRAKLGQIKPPQTS